jgi:hypothetical protein
MFSRLAETSKAAVATSISLVTVSGLLLLVREKARCLRK